MTAARLVLATLCLPLLAACEMEGGSFQGSEPRTIADRCVRKAASALRVKRDLITVTEALSVPEGDLVTMEVPGTGTVRCTADVDGVITELANMSATVAAAEASPG
ncbi:hypothetical protein [Frigidibacter sp. ROC022]|uniref:hypothetical protein n=1 Tax=Frigidibacter sp. ROC022 TaxID=2971796 RepID=UPI00215AC57F|nr:hypothetical protein [Frigidibacter sp. ROC022]MCR8725274.1 hypothetical protein [Frigidibacter sp. ROC022]